MKYMLVILNKKRHWAKLLKIEEMDPADEPLKTFLLVRIARGLGQSAEETDEWVSVSLALTPEVPLVYSEYILYLLPRWHGKPGEWQSWLQGQAQAGHWGDSGMPDELYAQVLWRVFQRIGNTDGLFFASPNLNWQKAWSGLEVCRSWDSSDVPFWKTVGVALALGTGDKKVLRQALEQLDGVFDTWVVASRNWAGVLNSVGNGSSRTAW